MRNENDGIDYQTIECAYCSARFSSDDDDVIYDEKRDIHGYFWKAVPRKEVA
jgi:hypothetical protein